MSLPFSACIQFLCSVSTSSGTCPVVSLVDGTRDILRNMDLIQLLITISLRAHNFSLFLVLKIFFSPYLIFKKQQAPDIPHIGTSSGHLWFRIMDTHHWRGKSISSILKGNLLKIYGLVKENELWRIRQNDEL